MAIKRIAFQLNLNKPKHKAIFEHLEKVKENDDISEYIRNVLLQEVTTSYVKKEKIGITSMQLDIDGID